MNEEGTQQIRKQFLEFDTCCFDFFSFWYIG